MDRSRFKFTQWPIWTSKSAENMIEMKTNGIENQAKKFQLLVELEKKWKEEPYVLIDFISKEFEEDIPDFLNFLNELKTIKIDQTF